MEPSEIFWKYIVCGSLLITAFCTLGGYLIHAKNYDIVGYVVAILLTIIWGGFMMIELLKYTAKVIKESERESKENDGFSE